MVGEPQNLLIAKTVGWTFAEFFHCMAPIKHAGLLTSAIAPLVRFSYGRMVVMAFPYTLVLGGVGLMSVIQFL
jgi:NhaB family Na+:H+ antiporter